MNRSAPPVMKNLTIRLSEEQIKHLKKRARLQKHRRIAKVVRSLVDHDIASHSN